MQNQLGYGQLVIKPISANLTHDSSVFSKMDCFAKFTIGSNIFTSAPAKNQGKTPTWQDSFNCQTKGEPKMHIEVWDKNTGKDDFIGEVVVEMKEVYQRPQTNAWYTLMRKGKTSGQIMVLCEFYGQGGGMPTQGMPNNYGGMPQQPGMGYPPMMPNPAYSNMAGMGQGMNMGMGGPGGLPPGFAEAMMGGLAPQAQSPYPVPPPQSYPPQNTPTAFPTQMLNNTDPVFDVFDRDRSGYLDRGEISKAVHYIYAQYKYPAPPQQTINFYIEAFDGNHDGKFSKTEFREFLRTISDI